MINTRYKYIYIFRKTTTLWKKRNYIYKIVKNVKLFNKTINKSTLPLQIVHIDYCLDHLSMHHHLVDTNII